VDSTRHKFTKAIRIKSFAAPHEEKSISSRRRIILIREGFNRRRKR
jgi:hypothetical protein